MINFLIQDNKKNHISWKSLQELTDIQSRIMNSITNPVFWMQDNYLQNSWHKFNMEQEIYWTQRARQNWIALGDKNTRLFQIAATIRKRRPFPCPKIYLRKKISR